MTAAATAAVLGIAAVLAVVVVTTREPARRDATLPAAGTVGAPPAPTAPPAAPPSGRPRPAAAGAVAILASAVRAQAVVAGVVSQVEHIDVHGWRADLRVDRVLLGRLGLGETVTVAWEELSAARQVRFQDGQRVLVVLDGVPTQSLWRKRFPVRERAQPVLVVAAGGDAFLPRPNGLTLDALEHYLAMAPDARAGAPGVRRLAELVRGGPPTVAAEALALLEAEPLRTNLSRSGGAAALLGADGAAALLAAARSPEREMSLRSAVLRFASRLGLPGTRETVLAASEPDSPLRADAYRALAALPDGLPAERAERLLAEADPSLRAVGVEVAGDRVARERLVALAQSDPSPDVRLAAGRALLLRQAGGGTTAASGGIADAVALLEDSDAAVRSGIAESLGALGTPVVTPLRAVVDAGSERAALAAILALSRTGQEGGATLAAIADTHQNESVRTFARLALGEAPGHAH